MKNEIRFNDLLVCGFNSDKEVYVYLWQEIECLSPNKVNELITFLAEQMKAIGEPIDILSK